MGSVLCMGAHCHSPQPWRPSRPWASWHAPSPHAGQHRGRPGGPQASLACRRRRRDSTQALRIPFCLRWWTTCLLARRPGWQSTQALSPWYGQHRVLNKELLTNTICFWGGGRTISAKYTLAGNNGTTGLPTLATMQAGEVAEQAQSLE